MYDIKYKDPQDNSKVGHSAWQTAGKGLQREIKLKTVLSITLINGSLPT